jgi:hypothetical protein
MSKLLFIFFDGIGLGGHASSNPFSAAPMQAIQRITGADFVSADARLENKIVFKGIDASMGVKGIPQSATGQTALLTGINAAQELGYHLAAYPDATLKEMLFQHNILKRAREKGFHATFANAYDMEAYNRLIADGKIYHSATTLSVLGAKMPFRTLEDLREGRAVYWDVTNRFLRSDRDVQIDIVEPEDAGRRLTGLLDENELVLFECFLPDILGHRRDFDKAMECVSMMDRFVGASLSSLGSDATLIVTSDHGNMEDMSTGGHTLNAVPLLAYGKDALRFSQAQSITDIAPIIMSVVEEKDLGS